MAQSSKPSPAAGDDRNIVAVDQIDEGLSFEDHLYLFWNRYKLVVLSAIALAIIAAGAIQVSKLLRERREAALQAAYGTAAAAGSSALRSFADSHPDHRLGGLARLALADEAYAAGRFAEAADLYTPAATALAGSPTGARARLGAAISRIRAGRTDDGRSALAALAADETEYRTVRAAASYHLAIVAAVAGDQGSFDKAVEQAIAIDSENGMPGPWASQAGELRSQVADAGLSVVRELPPAPADTAGPADGMPPPLLLRPETPAAGTTPAPPAP